MLQGGNPSAEEAEEALEAGASQINNVVHSFRLQTTTFDKKVRISAISPMFSLLMHSFRSVLPHLPQRIHEDGQGSSAGD